MMYNLYYKTLPVYVSPYKAMLTQPTNWVFSLTLRFTRLCCFSLKASDKLGCKLWLSPLQNHAVVCFESQWGINVDYYDSRPLYFLNFTYMKTWNRLFVLSGVFYLEMHVSVMYTYQYILLLQLMVSSVRPAVVSSFLGNNRT